MNIARDMGTTHWVDFDFNNLRLVTYSLATFYVFTVVFERAEHKNRDFKFEQ